MLNGHLIELRGVVKQYQSAAGTFTALRDVDLRVDPGEFVAVIGKSGSGKSTLINMITGIDRPTAGEVYVAGTPVHPHDRGRYHRTPRRRLRAALTPALPAARLVPGRLKRRESLPARFAPRPQTRP